ncbi:MAG: TatD family hydrolase [Hyphomonadaceae bacterium]|nr:TatD family hydrolase [Hyphomonadaceae bacterium]MBX3511871.1 TatD family hydrolase [Hyphomonadaceae bacterium]
MMLIDSHVNLHHEKFAPDREDVIARARAAGVARMITICDRLENFAQVLSIAEAHDDIFASLGAHPHYAKDHLDITADKLVALGGHPRVVGIGETGLDQHYKFSPFEDQVRVFRAHAEAARRLGKTLIIHTREADATMGDLLEEEAGKGPLRILMHCYTSGAELARRALALGAYISFSGIMTFKNAEDVRAIARQTPLDRIILETDCPYLAPVPHRGQRCEPAHVRDVQEAFCRLRGLSMEEGSALLAENFFRVFPDVTRPA